MSEWTRTSECVEPQTAFDAIARGEAQWFFHWCAGSRTKPGDATSTEALDYARQACIGRVERDRLAEKARRKGRTKTVVMAERWTHPSEGDLVVFFEAGPHPWPEREDPRRQP